MSGLGEFWYRPGISFKPTPMPKRVLRRKRVLMRYMPRGRAHRYELREPIWRRSAKAMTTDKLGFSGGELASFGEIDLGENTVNTQSSTTRNIWGSLTSIISKVGDVALQREQRKAEEARAVMAVREAPMTPYRAAGMLSPPVLIIAGVGLLGYVLYKKKFRR